MNPLEFFFLFFKASAITFAGMGALPVLQQDLVHVRGWTTDEEVAKALAIGRLSPGPNGMFVVSLGYLMMGWPGAALALIGSALPPLAVLPLAPIIRRSMHLRWVNGAMRGIALGSAGLLTSVGVGLVFPGLSLAGVPLWGLALAVGAGIATRSGKVHPVLILGVAAAGGIAFTAIGL